MELVLNENVKNICFICDGGIGKNIAGTAVVRAIKKAHPKKNIIVIAGCPEVFMNNPNVKRVFHFGNPVHFYEDWINEETQVVKEEPYFHYDYLQKTKHVVECWCEMIGVPFDGPEPEIHFIPSELDAAKIFADELTDGGKSKMVLLQWVGGQIPDKAGDTKAFKDKLSQMYRRAMPQAQAQAIADYLTKEKKYTVLTIGHPNFPQLEGVKNPNIPIRAIISLLTQCETFVGIDSFIQHAAASKQIQKKGVVVWGGTSKLCLGYDLHENMEINACTTPACHRPNSYLFDLQPNGQIWDCPWGEPCMKRPIADIIKSVESILV